MRSGPTRARWSPRRAGGAAGRSIPSRRSAGAATARRWRRSGRGRPAKRGRSDALRDMTVLLRVTDVAKGSERGHALRRIDWRRRRAQASALLERVGARVHADARAGDLGMAEQQLVGIARALGADARVVVMDEPTASLPDEEAGRVL